jgi:bifunctional UDP-N-acetylglucosamine pyrophosphorylase/glucosamine-1-phosphate N-acetyltransferase
MSTLAIVILAAGQGTRMRSKKQKILHDVGGKPMVQHVFEAATAVASVKPVLVVAPGETGVRTLFGDTADYTLQTEQLGTGHAALMAAPLLHGRSDQVLVMYGDMPLLHQETMRRLADKQAETGAAVVLLAGEGETSSTFGRVFRNDEGQVIDIIEVAEARRRPDGQQILAIRELNVGVYCFDANWLWAALPQLPLRQARGNPEYYLTDTIPLSISQGQRVEAVLSADPDESLGAGTRQEMIAVEKAFRQRANRRLLAAGVTLIDPDTTYIDPDVTVGQDTIIWPNTYLQGRTAVGEDCVIGPNTILRNARVGNGCTIEQSVIEDVTVNDSETIRPFTYRRSEIRD